MCGLHVMCPVCLSPFPLSHSPSVSAPTRALLFGSQPATCSCHMEERHPQALPRSGRLAYLQHPCLPQVAIVGKKNVLLYWEICESLNSNATVALHTADPSSPFGPWPSTQHMCRCRLCTTFYASLMFGSFHPHAPLRCCNTVAAYSLAPCGAMSGATPAHRLPNA